MLAFKPSIEPGDDEKVGISLEMEKTLKSSEKLRAMEWFENGYISFRQFVLPLQGMVF